MQGQFNQYDITKKLATKYSHATYLACPSNLRREHAEHEHQVVLTVFASSLFRFPHHREKLLQKAQRIKELQHSHIVPILDMGIEKEQPFVVRQYLPNGSLRSRLKRTSPDRLKLEDALTIVLQVGEALLYAHEHSVIHGNIKPENILFGADGQILLTDFYLVTKNDAIIRDQTSEQCAFCYLAPEQLTGTCDARSDQYALGCLAYELITGSVPFAAQTPGSMIEYTGNALPAPFSASVPDLPPALEAAVFMTLAQDPTERFFDLSSFLKVIQSVLSPAPAFPLGRSNHFRKNRTISHPGEPAKADDIVSPIRKRGAKRAGAQTLEPSEASLSSPTMFEAMSQLDAFTPELSADINLTQEKFDGSLLSKSFLEKEMSGPLLSTSLMEKEMDGSLLSKSFLEKEMSGSLLSTSLMERETDIPPLRALVSSNHGQNGFAVSKIVQSQTITIHVPASPRAEPSYRKKVLGLACLLAIIVVSLTYTFWSFGMNKPDTSLQPAQKMTHRIVSQAPTQAASSPIVQATALVSSAAAQPTPPVASPPIGQSSLQNTTNDSPSRGSVPTTNMRTIFYGWTDNTPEGTAIANPTMHQSAGGVGTYADPITFASSRAALSPGTIIYVPYLKKYFVMEDECSPCDSAWRNNHSYIINMWIGGDANSSRSAQQSCENSLARSSVEVEVQPPSDQVVDTTPLFTDSGGCIKL